RDFSFVFDDKVSFAKIHAAVIGLGVKELRGLGPVEIFRGGAIASGSYSILLRATFQSFDRTLRDDEIAGWTNAIVKALQALGGRLRAQ
ncbi:MAG TPA: hypothetical protein VKB88_16055, partial [Bryobacteraceae bacterium]|nr:hypothetical protein [Bryobacteraceae bacterium]